MTNEHDVIAGRAATILAGRLVAMLAAPIAAALVASVAALLIFGAGESTYPMNSALNWFLLTAAWAVGATLILGMPWHALAYARGWRRSWAYWPVGALVGLAIPASATVPFGVANELAHLIAYAGIVGGLTGLFFWLIRRPDRDVANPPTSSS